MTRRAAPTENVVLLNGAILHKSYRDFAHIVTKTTGHYQLQGEERITPCRFGVLRMTFELPYEFLKYYIFRRYIFGGADGFAYATELSTGRWARISILRGGEGGGRGKGPVSLGRKPAGWIRELKERLANGPS